MTDIERILNNLVNSNNLNGTEIFDELVELQKIYPSIAPDIDNIFLNYSIYSRNSVLIRLDYLYQNRRKCYKKYQRQSDFNDMKSFDNMFDKLLRGKGEYLVAKKNKNGYVHYKVANTKKAKEICRKLLAMGEK